MRKYLALAGLAATLLYSVPALAAPVVGEIAPAITAKDTNGHNFSLTDQKGKIVVLEWTNDGCPFVHKHYDSHNMQNLQKYAAEKGATWITIVSSAPGKQGNVTPEEANRIVTDQGATITAKILDPDGTIGHAYDAKSTPHMFVIDKGGKIAYMGAIDSDSSPRQSSIVGATNYVRAALDSLINDQPVKITQTEPYGCGVKY
jgi:peroxiredoxin